jgi:hypothetical protein
MVSGTATYGCRVVVAKERFLTAFGMTGWDLGDGMRNAARLRFGELG